MQTSSPISLPTELRLTPLGNNVVLVEGPTLASSDDRPLVDLGPAVLRDPAVSAAASKLGALMCSPAQPMAAVVLQSHQEPVAAAARAMGVPMHLAPPPLSQQGSWGRRRRRGPKGRRFPISR